ncbi:MAG: CHASE domain-containing protein [Pseudomonadota bacterium]|nr:CHASE domain-containing protein [Pseudomonadota bacterium]
MSSRSGYLLALLVLVGSLLLVAQYAKFAGEREQALAQARFVAEAEQAADLIRQRLLIYELSTRGGVSLFATMRRPTRAQWRSYVDGVALRRRFPSMQGLGFAEHLKPAGLVELQLQLRDSGQGLFELRPRGLRESYGPILYLEPQTPDNLAAIGYDMFSEPMRAQAMATARDQGETRMTRGVHLVQDADRPEALGVLMYSPFYRAGVVPATIQGRREAFTGWVYAPFRMREFAAHALHELPQPIALQIVDVTDGAPQLLYPIADDEAVFVRDGSALWHVIEREFYGRKWRIEFQSPPADTNLAARLTSLQMTLAVGLLASLLLFAVALSLARTQAQAQRIAARLSESHRRSELRFRNALQFSPIGQALLDRDGRILEANSALADILHSSPEQLAGTVFPAYFMDGKWDLSERGELRVIGTGVYQATRELRRSDGEHRHLRVTFAPVPGETGTTVDGLVQVEDVTDQLRAEAQVNALNRTLEARVALRTRELRQANEELQSFAYSVSHDLSAPLRSIDGFSRLLSERYADVIDEPGRGYLGRVRAATARMSDLIDALLKMSRLSRGALDLATLDLSSLAEEIVAELRTGEPGREVEVAIVPGLRASGDPALVHNLLLNLLGNAWKFSRDARPARIEFGLEADDGEMRTFHVRDNGAGFAQDYVDKLFRPFQRLHSQNEFAGHGIGLASVKRIVERHGGRISAEGAPGKGATFRFSLPVEETD